MARDKKLNIYIGAKDRASKAIRKIKDGIDAMHPTVLTLNQGFELLGKTVQAFTAAYDFTKIGAETEKMEFAFGKMAESIGADGDAIIAKVKNLTNNTISDFDAMRNAARMAALGLPIDKIGEFAAIARASAAAMGESTQYMFDSIVTGTARQSRLILDNLGIIISETEVYKEAQKKLGRELTDVEKKHAFLNAVIEKGMINVEAIGDTSHLTMDTFEQFEVSVDNLKRALATLLAGPMAKFLTVLASVASAIQSVIDKQDKLADQYQEPLRDQLQKLTLELEYQSLILLGLEKNYEKASAAWDLNKTENINQKMINQRLILNNVEQQIVLLNEKIKEYETSLNSAADAAVTFAEKSAEALAAMLKEEQGFVEKKTKQKEKLYLIASKLKKKETEVFTAQEKRQLAAALHTWNAMEQGLRAGVNVMMGVLYGYRVSVREVFISIARDFAKYFIDMITDLLIKAAARWLAILIIFGPHRENDMRVVQMGRDYANFFMAGVNDVMGKTDLVGTMNTGAIPLTTAPLTGGGRSIVINIQGNIIGQDEYVKDELIPAIESAIYSRETIIAGTV